VDVGMGRTGVREAVRIVDLARAADRAQGLVYRGIQGYSGGVQHITAFAERSATYGRQLDQLKAIVDALGAEGLAPELITGGGTGTYFIDAGRSLFTEHQAGSYIFMDVQYNEVELTETGGMPYETALRVHCSVISNNASGFVTTDGGFKCFATDGPFPQIIGGAPAGATYKFFGDEFGRVDFARPGQTLELGALVELATPHCDPTVNLHDYYHCVRGEELVHIWPIAGRGVL
jgi:D-serine deaminase-like pyridoxal phosphate-dependent protein